MFTALMIIICFLGFYFFLIMFLRNKSKFYREISLGQLKDVLEKLPIEMYSRKISLFVGNGTLGELIKNPEILDTLWPEDIDSNPVYSGLFQPRNRTSKNSFNRKLFDIPVEALQRKLNLSSGEDFILNDFKKDLNLFRKFSWKDFEKFSPEGGIFKPRSQNRDPASC